VAPTLHSPFLFAIAAATVEADERLEGIACRSVHLAYPASEGIAFYNEVTVEQSAPGTYFCACGWNTGYFGIQELGNGKKLVIFSVWDSQQNDPKAVDDTKRVKLIEKDEKVRTGRFGGEGTGGQSFYDYDWKIGATYRFLVTAKVNGDGTEYAGYFLAPDDKEWKHLVTFSTVTGGKKLGGYYSFVEDFQRDKVSLTKERAAKYGPTWVKSLEGKWAALEKARFTADKNPATNINAGVKDGRFFLATGGATKNTDTKLNDTMKLPKEKRSVPANLPN
jgi:hypothetical protein